MRHQDDQPRVGLILSKSKTEIIAEYMLRDPCRVQQRRHRGNKARNCPRRHPGRTRARERQAAAALYESLKESNCRAVRAIPSCPELAGIAAQSISQRSMRLIRGCRGEDFRKLRLR